MVQACKESKDSVPCGDLRKCSHRIIHKKMEVFKSSVIVFPICLGNIVWPEALLDDDIKLRDKFDAMDHLGLVVPNLLTCAIEVCWQ